MSAKAVDISSVNHGMIRAILKYAMGVIAPDGARSGLEHIAQASSPPVRARRRTYGESECEAA